MFAYVGSFTTAKRKARGDGLHVYRIDPATGAKRARQNDIRFSRSNKALAS